MEIEAGTMEDVMETMGGRFIRLGYCRDYVQALKERELEFPTGIDIDGVGVAMPHMEICQIRISEIESNLSGASLIVTTSKVYTGYIMDPALHFRTDMQRL